MSFYELFHVEQLKKKAAFHYLERGFFLFLIVGQKPVFEISEARRA